VFLEYENCNKEFMTLTEENNQSQSPSAANLSQLSSLRKSMGELEQRVKLFEEFKALYE
jgi:peptide chain release factor 1